MKISVKSQLIMALSVILLISFTVTSVINYRVSRESIRTEIMTSSLPLTGETIYSEIHSDLLKPINVSSLMANDTFLRSWIENGERDTGKVVDYLTEIKNKYGFFASFFVSARTGAYYHPGGILKTVSPGDGHDVWFYSFLDSGQEYDLDVDTNEAADNSLTIFINYRVEGTAGDALGVAGVGLEMDRVTRLLRHYQRKYDRAIYMVDQNGVIQTHSTPELIGTGMAARLGDMAQAMKQVLSVREEARQYQLNRDGRHFLVSVRYIPEFDWTLVVEQDERSVLASARNNLVRTMAIGLLASVIIIVLSSVAVNHFQKQLELMATTDELTGVGNRREFETQFERAQHRRERHKLQFCLILLDIDGLKQVNDNLGHLAGDRVIIAVSRLILDGVRSVDVVARWGGDEFMVLVEGDIGQACIAAERIRQSVDDAGLPELETGWHGQTISVSCGVARYRSEDTLDSLTHRADQALYRAKQAGRNCVVADGN